MDEPIGFWVRQIATDGAVIAVRAVPGQETTRPAVGAPAAPAGQNVEQRRMPAEAEAA